ncbi:high-affinity Zn(2+) transporter zrt1, partial [Steccherinum ochraceum]
MRNAQYHQLHLLRRDDAADDSLNCGSGGGSDTFFGLRVASVFIILVGSMSGALFPVLARRTKWLNVPDAVFDFAKYFGSGVIIATAFIHLLDPAIEELSSPCLDPAWLDYPYALAFALISIFAIFIVEILAFRWGTAKLNKIGISHDPHGHAAGGAHAAHGPELSNNNNNKTSPNISGASTSPRFIDQDQDQEKLQDEESAISQQEIIPTRLHEDEEHGHGHGHGGHVHVHDEGGFVVDSAATQILGVAILEFGVMLHSVLIGLTLAVDENFKVLFVVIIFH